MKLTQISKQWANLSRIIFLKMLISMPLIKWTDNFHDLNFQYFG